MVQLARIILISASQPYPTAQLKCLIIVFAIQLGATVRRVLLRPLRAEHSQVTYPPIGWNGICRTTANFSAYSIFTIQAAFQSAKCALLVLQLREIAFQAARICIAS